MSETVFSKYTVLGNTFVLVDEIDVPRSAAARAAFARFATDPHAGVGADNLLVIERSTVEILRKANVPCGEAAPEFVFRMFEPNGDEACMCGNGLLAVAHHLGGRRGISAARILTEMPSPQPVVRRIGPARHAGCVFEVEIGQARTPPADFVAVEAAEAWRDGIGRMRPVRVGMAGCCGTTLRPHIVYTGEPHLVVFGAADCESAVFGDIHCPAGAAGVFDCLGKAINREHGHLFPQGVNVSFVRPLPEGTLEYRCFERGLLRETLACGTAAVAIAEVVRHTIGLAADTLSLHPGCCRAHGGFGAATVELLFDACNGWWLQGDARCLFTATLGEAHSFER